MVNDCPIALSGYVLDVWEWDEVIYGSLEISTLLAWRNRRVTSRKRRSALFRSIDDTVSRTINGFIRERKLVTDTVQSIDYNQASEELRREIAALLHRVWPDVCMAPEETIPAAHDKDFHARSFFSYADGRLVSYAGVVFKTIKHEGQTFKIAGLSSVATDPGYQGRGLGFRTVSAATRWVEQSNADFGIFTCEPSLARFYEQAGSWRIASDVILSGSRNEGALSSDTLPVVVLMRLFSTKARAFESILRHTTIYLDLPAGKFL